jgi:hypothetical protein
MKRRLCDDAENIVEDNSDNDEGDEEADATVLVILCCCAGMNADATLVVENKIA